jgi:hypothetical protein
LLAFLLSSCDAKGDLARAPDAAPNGKTSEAVKERLSFYTFGSGSQWKCPNYIYLQFNRVQRVHRRVQREMCILPKRGTRVVLVVCDFWEKQQEQGSGRLGKRALSLVQISEKPLWTTCFHCPDFVSCRDLARYVPYQCLLLFSWVGTLQCGFVKLGGVCAANCSSACFDCDYCVAGYDRGFPDQA